MIFGKRIVMIFCKIVQSNFQQIYPFVKFHGGLSQWGRSNRPRIRPGAIKSLNAPWELSQLALSRDYVKKIDPRRLLVWLGRRTVPQDRVSTRCYLAGRYKLGRSCSNLSLLRGQSGLFEVGLLWLTTSSGQN